MGPGSGLFQVGKGQLGVAEEDMRPARPRYASGNSGSRRSAVNHSTIASFNSPIATSAFALRT